jgi:hypothetical protein
MKTSILNTIFWNSSSENPPIVFKNEHWVAYFLLVIFIIPWQYFDIEHVVRIKEFAVIMSSLLVFLKCLMSSKIFIDNSGRSYFLFIMLTSLYLGIDFVYLHMDFDLKQVVHIYLFVLFNFSIYLLVLNLNLSNLNLSLLMFIFKFVYLLIFLYFFLYAYEIHSLIKNIPANFFTMESLLWQRNENIIYMGGTNSKSWFFLILTSFLVGFYRSKAKYFVCLFLIAMTILISSLLLSRSAMLFSFILAIIYWISLPKNKFFILLLTLFSIILFTLFSPQIFSEVTKSLSKKEGQSTRVNLVFESLEFASENLFFGKGFHYSGINRGFFNEKKYPALRKNNTQNSYLSILIEIGIIGVFLYFLIWFLCISRIRKTIRIIPDTILRHYLNGVKIMIIFILFMGFFHHFIDKNFTFMPILIIFTAIGINLTYHIREEL